MYASCPDTARIDDDPSPIARIPVENRPLVTFGRAYAIQKRGIPSSGLTLPGR